MVPPRHGAAYRRHGSRRHGMWCRLDMVPPIGGTAYGAGQGRHGVWCRPTGRHKTAWQRPGSKPAAALLPARPIGRAGMVPPYWAALAAAGFGGGRQSRRPIGRRQRGGGVCGLPPSFWTAGGCRPAFWPGGRMGRAKARRGSLGIVCGAGRGKNVIWERCLGERGLHKNGVCTGTVSGCLERDRGCRGMGCE